MENLQILATPNTPAAKFNPVTGVLLLEGRCIPENPSEFFNHLNSWIKTYFLDPLPLLKIEIKLEYINSGSAKQILNFLRNVESLPGSEVKVAVNWHYEEDDEAIEELGQDLKNSLKFPFELISF